MIGRVASHVRTYLELMGKRLVDFDTCVCDIRDGRVYYTDGIESEWDTGNILCVTEDGSTADWLSPLEVEILS